MGPLWRVLNVVLWVAAAPFVASLFLSDLAAGLFGERGSRVVNVALLVAIVVCCGAITSYESGRNPIADTERGERTNRQLFFALVFTIGFFLGGYFIAVAVF
jgi:MFS family permease